MNNTMRRNKRYMKKKFKLSRWLILVNETKPLQKILNSLVNHEDLWIKKQFAEIRLNKCNQLS